MLILVFLVVQCHGLIQDSRFEVTKCSSADGQPELTFTIDESYFEQHLSSKANQDGSKRGFRIDCPAESVMVQINIISSSRAIFII